MKIGLIGKTNAGKSTLFNRMIGNYRAIVTDIYGTTREILKEPLVFTEDKKAILMDSPGLDVDGYEEKSVKKIIQQSDILLWVVDSQTDLGTKDYQIQKQIIDMGAKDHTILVVNKMDGKTKGQEYDMVLADYYSLGMETIVGVSAKTNQAIDTLKDKILEFADEKDLKWGAIPDSTNYNKIAIVGRPNVGKSTLLNSYVGDDIAAIKDEWGTTLDYRTANFNYDGQDYKLFDTAGIRKKGKVKGLEKIAFNKTKKMLEHVRPTVILMIDGEEGIVHRDRSLFAQLQDLKLPILIVVNKMDSLDEIESDRTFEKVVDFFRFARRVPVLPISAEYGTGLKRVLKFISNIDSEYNKSISTSQLNKALQKLWLNNPPRFPKNKVCKFYYLTQIQSAPPKFKVYINNKSNLNFAFKQWLENALRREFGWIGTPLSFEFIDKSSLSEDKQKKIEQKSTRN